MRHCVNVEGFRAITANLRSATAVLARFARCALSASAVAAMLLSNPGVSPVAAQEPRMLQRGAVHNPVISRHGMVVSRVEIANRIGADILARGGNAVDAAVAVGFALAVTLPVAGNIGGGGFMLVYLAEEDRVIAIDYRETAPAAASRDMYLDADGEVQKDVIRFSHLASGVPGTVAGFHHALTNYGTMSWAEVIAPAIKLAAEGFPVYRRMSENFKRYSDRLLKNPASRQAFYKPGGTAYEVGEIFRQPDLAWTLGEIAAHGRDGFYQGAVARKIVAEMDRGGGLISLEDLANYRVIERQPVEGTYRGYRIISMPPPSSGGLHIIQMLNILENFDLKAAGAGSARSVHLIAEAMRLAFADRSEHLGDPDFHDVPVEWLTSKEYGRALAATIPLDAARPSDEVRPGVVPAPESPDTTNFVVMDAAGNVVVNNYSINLSFGSGITVSGAGFLLNDEMDDFSAKPGAPNAYGLLGKEANAVAPGKRPLSSMSPTIVFRDGKPFLATGGRGGSRIITAVLQTIINVIDFDMNIADATHAPRQHHQWYPDILYMESGFSPDTLAILAGMGHQIKPIGLSGSVQSAIMLDGYFFGATDPRRGNAGAIGAGAPAADD
ncbi:MAG: gamma-glutamyltransferase [Proteobacteria bacterium]|nr:gamma-glutamyltransferase [Pseudomonadota bacterium]